MAGATLFRHNRLVVGNLTDVGRVRSNNEDFYGNFFPVESPAQEKKGVLFVVADGMGGHAGGEVASRLAVETVREAYFAPEASEDMGVALRLAVETANSVIYRESRRSLSSQGMGTTLTAFVIRDNEGFVAHVGDSRAYLLRGKRITQLTEDHSKVGALIRSGLITEDAARQHPESNILLRALGTSSAIQVDTQGPIPLARGTQVILCTDGLHSLVGREEIARICCKFPPQEACRQLVSLASERGGHDNITVQIIKNEGMFAFPFPLRPLWAGSTAVLVILLVGTGFWLVSSPPEIPHLSVIPTIPPYFQAVKGGPSSFVIAAISTLQDPLSIAVDEKGNTVVVDGERLLTTPLMGNGKELVPLPRAEEEVAPDLRPRRLWMGSRGVLFGEFLSSPAERTGPRLILAVYDSATRQFRPVLLIGEPSPRGWWPRVREVLFTRAKYHPQEILIDDAESVQTWEGDGKFYILTKEGLYRVEGSEPDVFVLSTLGFRRKPVPPSERILPSTFALSTGGVPMFARKNNDKIEVAIIDATGVHPLLSEPTSSAPSALAMGRRGEVYLQFPEELWIVQKDEGKRFVTKVVIAHDTQAGEPAFRLSRQENGKKIEWSVGTPRGTEPVRVQKYALSREGRWWAFVYEGRFFLADLHALTVPPEAGSLP